MVGSGVALKTENLSLKTKKTRMSWYVKYQCQHALFWILIWANRVQNKLDALDDIFGKPKKPLKGSPTARKNPMNFFNEVDDSQLNHYSIRQIELILAQRKNILDVARRANLGEFRKPVPPQNSNLDQYSLPLPFKFLPRSEVKPWLPFLGGECQTKYCHSCWPHGLARSWMSLDGIVKGDFPREAVHGLSFILMGERTVSNVKHVANLGLRPNPTTVKASILSPASQFHSCPKRC